MASAAASEKVSGKAHRAPKEEDSLDEVVCSRQDGDVALLVDHTRVSSIEEISLATETVKVSPANSERGQLPSLLRVGTKIDLLLKPLLVVPNGYERRRRKRSSEHNIAHVASLDRLAFIVDDPQVHAGEREACRAGTRSERREVRGELDGGDGTAGLG